MRCRTALLIVLLFLVALCEARPQTQTRGFLFTEAEKDLVRQMRAAGQTRESEELVTSMLANAYKIGQLNSALAPPCTCECYADDFILDPILQHGYGKYCGPGYSCANMDAGCDPVDECCRVHDACVGEASYCGSCDCNIALVACVASLTNTTGFLPCAKAQTARHGILDDVCFVIEYAPAFCGGCSRPKHTTPQTCLDYNKARGLTVDS